MSSQEWEEAKLWFTNMDQTIKNNLILIIYRLCLTTKDSSHKKLEDSLNNQWTDKLNEKNKDIENLNNQWTDKLNEKNKDIEKLSMIVNVLKKNQEQNINVYHESINKLEHKFSESLNSIALKITPTTNGKLGENYIESLLGKIPNSSLSNISKEKGNGDFLYVQNNIKIMIESKNWTNSSIKSNPKEIESFKETAVNSKEEGNIDFAIMALHRVTDLQGKAISMETVYTSRGRLLLMYVTNLFNHPDRLLYAIDAGILLLEQNTKNNMNSDKFLYQIENFMKNIEKIDNSIKERNKIVKNLALINKKDYELIETIKFSITNVINEQDKTPLKDRIVYYCWELIEENENDVNKITKQMLEQKIVKGGIAARWIREFGGFKTIKKLACEKFNFTDDNIKLQEEEELTEL